MKTILITGGTGFLGSNILLKLLKKNYKIILLKRSFSDASRLKTCLAKMIVYDIDKTSVESVFKNNKIDIVLHCATDYGRKKKKPSSIINANLILPLQLLELAQDYGVKCMINTDTILDKRVSYYSLSKNHFRDWLQLLAGNTVCINVAIEHFYGAGDDKTKFVSFIIDSLLGNVDKIELTKGEQKRDFVFIEDVVDAFLRIINNSGKMKKGYYYYQIGSDKQITIRETVEALKKISGNKITALNFGALPYRKNEVMKSKVDTTRLRKLGWKPKVTLLEGLRKTVKLERKRREL